MSRIEVGRGFILHYKACFYGSILGRGSLTAVYTYREFYLGSERFYTSSYS